MTEAKTIVTEKGLTMQDRLDKMIDAILLLRSLGLEPTGFIMDADTLYHFTNFCATDEFIEKFIDPWGGINLEEVLPKYDFSIMGIPIEPDFHGRVIKARRKEDEREITTNSKSV